MLRQIPSIMSWARCFCAYAAVCCSGARSAGHNFWVYLRLILQEAARNGGDGWRLHDTRFRQLPRPTPRQTRALSRQDSTLRRFLRWAALHWLDGDHVAADCALAPLAPVTKPNVLTTARSQRERAPADKPICCLYDAGRCTFRDCSFRPRLRYKVQHRSRDCVENSEAKRSRSARAQNGE